MENEQIVMDSEESSVFDQTYSVQTNPLLIDTVLLYLFSLVDHDTLKNTRLVTRKWKDVCDSSFINRSAFLVRSKNNVESDPGLEFPEDIPSLFSSIDQERNEVSFQAFKFRLESLTTPLLEMYLTPNKLTMTHLEIVGEWISAPFVSQYVDHVIGPNLEKLKLQGGKDMLWLVSLERLSLSPIKEIDLTNCTIVVNSETKMAPKLLKLVTYRFTGIEKQMREIIDFRLIQKLHIDNSLYYTAEGMRIFNLSDCPNIKSLTFISVHINLDGKISPVELTLQNNQYGINRGKVFNFSLHNYLISTLSHIKKLTVKDKTVKLNFANSIVIDQLEITDYWSITGMNKSAIIKNLILNPVLDSQDCDFLDLSSLPQTIESIIFHKPNNMFVTCSKPLCFPVLKNLYIKGDVGCNLISRFRNCHSLTVLTLEPADNSSCDEFNVDCLPRNIRKLYLRGQFSFNTSLTGNKLLKLELLAISCSSCQLNEMYEIKLRHKIQANLVVFQKCSEEGGYFNEDDVAKIMMLKHIMAIKNIAFGPVKWLQNSVLFVHVDKTAEYFLIEGDDGKGICKTEFYKMTINL